MFAMALQDSVSHELNVSVCGGLLINCPVWLRFQVSRGVVYPDTTSPKPLIVGQWKEGLETLHIPASGVC